MVPRITPNALPPVRCPLCQAVERPAESLPGKCFRCAKCGATFQSTATRGSLAAKPLLQPIKRKSARATVARDPGALREWLSDNKVIVSAAATVAILLVLFSAVFAFRSDAPHLAVHPARGEISFEGKPMPGAVVFLHANSRLIEDDDSPIPRGTVNADGTFELGTYGKDDGAPPASTPSP